MGARRDSWVRSAATLTAAKARGRWRSCRPRTPRTCQGLRARRGRGARACGARSRRAMDHWRPIRRPLRFGRRTGDGARRWRPRSFQCVAEQLGGADFVWPSVAAQQRAHLDGMGDEWRVVDSRLLVGVAGRSEPQRGVCDRQPGELTCAASALGGDGARGLVDVDPLGTLRSRLKSPFRTVWSPRQGSSARVRGQPPSRRRCPWRASPSRPLVPA